MNITDGVTLMESLYVTVFSMVIVYAALAAIAGILSLLKYVGTDEKAAKATQTAPAAPLATTSAVATPNFEVEVAIAVATIEAFSGVSADNFVVKNIRKVPQETSAWAMAGRQTHTQQVIK